MSTAVLLVDDDRRFAELLSNSLRKDGHDVEHAATAAEALRLVRERAPDVVLLDLVLPDMDGLTVLERIRELDGPPAVVVMTAHASVATAVAAMRLGALDYITKPIDLEALALKLGQTRRLLGLRADLEYVLERDRPRGGASGLVGNCPAMRAVYARVEEVARTDATTVLVTGPSGTGKELVARAVHSQSARRGRPLMQIDCTAIPVALLESELFGHERGAFTGADRMKKGLLELSDGGTLLLDEIGDMPVELQAKLLRVLQERQLRRVGGTRELRFDTRVIAATNQDLERLCDDGRFRRDLLFRLKVFQIALPPLCERGDDILTLAEAFILEYAATFRKPVRELDEEARAALLRYPFPGNVRELRNLIEQAVILCRSPVITRDLLPIVAAAPAAATTPTLRLESLGPHPLAAAERELIRQALDQSGGNQRRAAQLLGISRFALQRRLQRANAPAGDEDE
jgi:two-component system NtrC family response regulator